MNYGVNAAAAACGGKNGRKDGGRCAGGAGGGWSQHRPGYGGISISRGSSQGVATERKVREQIRALLHGLRRLTLPLTLTLTLTPTPTLTLTFTLTLTQVREQIRALLVAKETALSAVAHL